MGPQQTRPRSGRSDPAACQPPRSSLTTFGTTLPSSASDMAVTASALMSPKTLLMRSDRIDRRRDVKWQQWPEMACQQNELDAESLTCSHPDLEDGSLIGWGIQQSQNANGEGVEIDVLYGNGTDLRKHQRRTSNSTSESC